MCRIHQEREVNRPNQVAPVNIKKKSSRSIDIRKNKPILTADLMIGSSSVSELCNLSIQNKRIIFESDFLHS